jgi:uncharacterized protein (TIGR00725 family)
MDKERIIGIMGPGENATPSDLEMAFQLGRLLAELGFYVLTGGRASGVMEAAMKGAKSAGGITIGILPTEDGRGTSTFVDIPIKTGMGSARNNINVLSSDVVVAIGIGAGTTSEISLAIKAQKPIIWYNWNDESRNFFSSFKQADITFSEDLEKISDLIQSKLG